MPYVIARSPEPARGACTELRLSELACTELAECVEPSGFRVKHGMTKEDNSYTTSVVIIVSTRGNVIK